MLVTAELYKRYATAFSAVPDGERRRILDAVLDTGIVYRTPNTEGNGHQVVLDDISNFQRMFPGASFALRSISEHHDVALMEWQLILADGTPAVRGHDAVRITPEGKFGQITTFAPFTPLPALGD